MKTASLFTPDHSGQDLGASIAGALSVLDQFTDRFNQRDLAGMDACLHFPHIILSGEAAKVWEAPGALPADFFPDLEQRIGWAESVYTRRDAILISKDKVHFLIGYTRNRKDGSVISSHENIWIVTREGGRWGIKLRSY